MTDDLKTKRALDGYRSQGACNPGGLARSLVRHFDEAESQEEILRDPGMRLLAYQLAYLFLGHIDYAKWQEDYKYCEEIYKQDLPDREYFFVFEKGLECKYVKVIAKTEQDARALVPDNNWKMYLPHMFEEIRCCWHKEVTLEELCATQKTSS